MVSHNAAMAEKTFSQFESLLRIVVVRDFSLELDFLGLHSEDLSRLEEPFTTEEIWEGVRRLPHGKAPGPDGFPAKFIQRCWRIVSDDFMATFHKLFTMCG